MNNNNDDDEMKANIYVVLPIGLVLLNVNQFKSHNNPVKLVI